MSSSEAFLFSTGRGFLCGALAGYAIKKILKIGAIIVGLFVLGLGYLSYRGWINVNWAATENGTRQALVSAVNQTALVVKHTSAQFAAQHMIFHTLRYLLQWVSQSDFLLGFIRDR